ncbi:N-acetylgalactosamine-N,N'-diacetylbacillosaminyl-diphospho-undecaprenol 4-alpha-N-acetylgalactosaminyltransferase [Rosistilla carotiformis]|uniref:N-acetylgalactosamine-N, N'-diacetylbacillosaminyl-diphospho-undecaprenol 4-alpha-N-acetylgalactosaminyltransferase n=1 Tax=Rosistilla carotiformis TaxID=2528017 RepID=A0A518K0V8_9BACT|nr:glycosyltransferase [Rosistilla carotiformis]QDV71421.1 N-acetylgalactosamine-N,N'-diacetylbacillosaminyl-diphospho-undecaprenol 4-alpha-N-acetylgalactosaminyltransferase [Rosistilla carotiformis]
MNRPISLLIVSTTLDSGGAERFASTLLANIDRKKVQPELVVLRDKLGYPLPDDVGVHQLGHQRDWDTARTVFRLRKLLNKRKPDVVLSNITATNIVTGMAIRQTLDRPRWIARVGNSPRLHDSLLKSWGATFVYPRADKIVANSVGLTDELRDRYCRLSGRITTIANPTDLQELAQQSTRPQPHPRRCNGPLLIAVGRLCQQKRYDLMLNAFAQVRQQVLAELWICGDGPLHGQLSQRIRKLNLTNSVRMLGFCRNPHSLMAQADLFLMTSDHEGSPNALIEAQVLGIPAVATRCPYGPEEIIVEGKTGLLSPVGEAGTFADAVLDALQAKDLLTCTSAYEQVRQRFDANQRVRQWEDLICQTVTATLSTPVEDPAVLQAQSP